MITKKQFADEFADLAHTAGITDTCAIEFTDEVRISERSYADVDPRTLHFRFAPETLGLPWQHRRGLIMHEIGHVLDPDGSEQDADDVARAVFGETIIYDQRWPGKGLQCVRARANPSITNAERHTLGRIIEKFDREDAREWERWGHGIRHVFVSLDEGDYKNYRTLINLEKRGLIVLDRHVAESESLKRGAYGKWVGGTTKRSETAFYAAPTDKGRELIGARSNPYYAYEGQSAQEVIDAWQQRGDKLYDPEARQHGYVSVAELWPHREYTWTREDARRRPEEWDALYDSIAAEGIKEPLQLLIGRAGGTKIGEGNHRLAIARELGIEEVPVMFQFYSGSVRKQDWGTPPRSTTPEEEEEIDEIMDLLGARQNPELPLIDQPEFPALDKEWRWRDTHVAECHFCGRPLTEKAAKTAVEMTTDLRLVPVGRDVGDSSQGLFLVGPTCAKKVPKAYRHKRLEENPPYSGYDPRYYTRKLPKDQTRLSYRTKRDALNVFLDWNRAIVDDYGGESTKHSPASFDTINHRFDITGSRRVDTIAKALWWALPAGSPYYLEDIDVDLLNRTAPAIFNPRGLVFTIPDHAEEARLAEQEAEYWEDRYGGVFPGSDEEIL